MRLYKLLLLISVLSLVFSSSHAQTINWASLDEEDNQILSVNFGAEYGFVYGLGYGYHINNRLFDIVPSIEFSIPSGDNLFDDFKTKVGIQVRWYEFRDFQFSTKVMVIIRRYENDFTRILNFGSDFTGIVGYYRNQWFAAGEFGFDKAIVSHFKHSDSYKGQYQGVVDGWYEPSTGGNFYYGLQGGYSFRNHDIYLKAGKIIAEDFKTDPLLPFYAKLAYNIKFGKKQFYRSPQ